MGAFVILKLLNSSSDMALMCSAKAILRSVNRCLALLPPKILNKNIQKSSPKMNVGMRNNVAPIRIPASTDLKIDVAIFVNFVVIKCCYMGLDGWDVFLL